MHSDKKINYKFVKDMYQPKSPVDRPIARTKEIEPVCILILAKSRLTSYIASLHSNIAGNGRPLQHSVFNCKLTWDNSTLVTLPCSAAYHARNKLWHGCSFLIALNLFFFHCIINLIWSLCRIREADNYFSSNITAKAQRLKAINLIDLFISLVYNSKLCPPLRNAYTSLLRN